MALAMAGPTPEIFEFSDCSSAEWTRARPGFDKSDHDELQLLVPGERYMVDVEIWPASLYLPAGYRLDLTLEGKDFALPGAGEGRRGSGPFTHTDPVDRDPQRYGGVNTIYLSADQPSYLLLPVLG
jgi:predicted acyl esterase